MKIVFVYQNHERSFAERLAFPLEESGYNVILAPAGLKIGSDNWKKQVKIDFSSADLIIALITKRFILDNWVAWRVEQVFKCQHKKFLPMYFDHELLYDKIVPFKTWKVTKEILSYNWFFVKKPEDALEYIKRYWPLRAYFDVFMAHNSNDKELIARVADHLRARGIKPWLDKEQIPPGKWFQDEIKHAIQHSKSAAIFIGKDGVGKWQVVELRSFVTQCINSGCPIIPVLLPGVDDIPSEFVFLREMTWVQFQDTIQDKKALDQLEWGITGKKP